MATDTKSINKHNVEIAKELSNIFGLPVDYTYCFDRKTKKQTGRFILNPTLYKSGFLDFMADITLKYELKATTVDDCLADLRVQIAECRRKPDFAHIKDKDIEFLDLKISLHYKALIQFYIQPIKKNTARMKI